MNLAQSLVEMQNRPGARTISAATHEHHAGEFVTDGIDFSKGVQGTQAKAGQLAAKHDMRSGWHSKQSDNQANSAPKQDQHAIAADHHADASESFDNAAHKYSAGRKAQGDRHFAMGKQSAYKASKAEDAMPNW